MYASRIILIILIVLGLVNNFRFQFLRIPSILIWALIPAFYIFISKNYRNINKSLLINYVVPYFLLTIILFFPILYNINGFELELSGSSVEKITAFLTPFSCVTFVMLSGVSVNKFKNFNRSIDIGVWLIIGFFLFEALYRYSVAPELFLNYFKRHPAKTIGLLSTTNVNGQVLTLLFVSLLVIPFKKKFLALSIILILLITSMARSAIVSLLIVWLMFLIYKSNFIFKVILTTVAFFISGYLLFDIGMATDGSLLSKIEFISATKTIIDNSDLIQLVFGYGMSYQSITNTLGVQGWSPHLPILKAFLYYGIFGVIYYIGTIFLLYRFNNKILLPMIAYLILSLAGAPLFFPGLLSILIIISKNE
jgi:hypothetical protein